MQNLGCILDLHLISFSALPSVDGENTLQCIQPLNTANFTIFNTHSPLHATHCTLQTVHGTLHTMHCTQNTAHCTLDPASFKLHTWHTTFVFSNISAYIRRFLSGSWSDLSPSFLSQLKLLFTSFECTVKIHGYPFLPWTPSTRAIPRIWPDSSNLGPPLTCESNFYFSQKPWLWYSPYFPHTFSNLQLSS